MKIQQAIALKIEQIQNQIDPPQPPCTGPIKIYFTENPGNIPLWYGEPPRPARLPKNKSDLLEFREEQTIRWGGPFIGVYVQNQLVAWYRRDGNKWMVKIGRPNPKWTSRYGLGPANIMTWTRSEKKCLEFLEKEIAKWISEISLDLSVYP